MVTLKQFTDDLVHSRLMTEAELGAFLGHFPVDRRPSAVESLATELVRSGRLTKYQAAAIYQGKANWLVLGEYVVVEKLGQGGMGVVLKAEHRRMKRTVAIKVLTTTARSTTAVKRFHREVEMAAKLSHPNIVSAYDAGEQDDVVYLVMEYVNGKDLGTLVKQRGPLSIKGALECSLQVAKGLQYAHANGVIHRDVKPGNLLLDQEGHVKILDMGLARYADADAGPSSQRLTQMGQVMGTGEYMAPEQGLDPRSADHRADIYSLGCTMFRLLTGRPPYKGDSLVAMLQAHREAPIPSLCTAREGVSPALNAVFRKMVAKSPLERYQSMAEVVADLDACLAGKTPAAMDTESVGPAPSSSPRVEPPAPASSPYVETPPPPARDRTPLPTRPWDFLPMGLSDQSIVPLSPMVKLRRGRIDANRKAQRRWRIAVAGLTAALFVIGSLILVELFR